MARILAYTSPGRSHLFPLTPILDELHSRGHEVMLRTLSGEVSAMRARGFDTEPISAPIETIELDDWRARSSLESVRQNTRAFCARAEYDAPDLSSAIAATDPDALLVDINSWGALMTAEAWGGPWAVFCPYPLALRSIDAPPFGPGLAPARGPLGRARDSLLRPLVFGTIERQGRPALNRIREQMSLAPVATLAEWFARAPLLLYMTAEPFEYPRRDWPENVVMIGPCAWDPPGDPPPWLAELSRPIVLVSTSTEFQNDGRLVQVALQALAQEPVSVVATLPTAGDPAALEIPANAHVERFISHQAILEQAACAITHGGMGSTQKALSHGVPVCAVPFGRDQLEVARRVEVAHAGTRLPARRLRADRLREKVREAMTCTEGARRIAAAYTATGGAGTAADAVDVRLLNGPVQGAGRQP
ncbi:MAG TPA: glycosyltransferase [Solirubrobacteraceae bacterium]|jgi:MGT family glycosyltransferase|nr:glycosyltransferase [Solirubrobacteraceae bacterium]